MMLSLRPFAARFSGALASAVARPLTTSAPLLKGANLPPRPKPPPEDEIEENFVKGSGPGGQKINKTNSAVQLKHIPTGIVVKSQATRSRAQNRQIARNLLAARLDEIANGDSSREAAVAERKMKKRASKMKKSRRKYRALEAGKETAEEELEEEEEEQAPGEAMPRSDDGRTTEEEPPRPGAVKPSGAPE